MLRHAAAWCGMLRLEAAGAGRGRPCGGLGGMWRHGAAWCGLLGLVAACCGMLRHVAACCGCCGMLRHMLRHAAAYVAARCVAKLLPGAGPAADRSRGRAAPCRHGTTRAVTARKGERERDRSRGRAASCRTVPRSRADAAQRIAFLCAFFCAACHSTLQYQAKTIRYSTLMQRDCAAQEKAARHNRAASACCILHCVALIAVCCGRCAVPCARCRWRCVYAIDAAPVVPLCVLHRSAQSR